MSKKTHDNRKAPSWLKAHSHTDSANNQKQSKESKRNILLHFYDKHYKKLLIFPMLMLLAALTIVISKYAMTGEFINRGVTLKGGITLEIYQELGISEDQIKKDIESNFEMSSAEVSILKNIDGTYRATSIYVSGIDSAELLNFVSQKYNSDFIQKNNYQINQMESTFSGQFFSQLIISILVAFAFMGIVVFIIYKVPIPSLAVILSIFADVIETVAIFDIFGIQISAASIAAFMMLIGYSVDTDILLSTKVLKQQGNTLEKIVESMKTGIMMVGTAFAVVLVCYLFTSSATLKEIMLVIMVGIVIDVINTWITNAALLRMYVERRK